ncbi:MAG: recombinase RecT [Sphingomonas sp.]|uniref:recombinase RecT n=1 Tax=Sphingomonas sp. TaxID=28214 RepID=UPI00260F4379|nr:recombinase RecT [Sphingomonas sp.]MDK2769933.1 recombinase RecT [Sphingomonas sp.]
MAQANHLPALKTDIAKMHGEFAKALPGHITPDRFVRTAQTAIALTRNIEKVTNPASLLAACSKAASDGLILDGREAALVVDYNGDVQYRPMMRGLLKLAYNSGEIRGIVVEVVRKGDVFRHSPTKLSEPITHEIDHEGERGDPHTVYALAELREGGIVHEVMSVADVNRIRDRSDAYKAFKAGKIKSTPWSTDWSEMARKTVFRRLSKYLPSSTDRDRFQQAVERIDDDYRFEIDNDDPAGEAKPAPAAKKRGGAAAALKDVTPKAAPQQARQEPQKQADPPHDPETGEIIEGGDYFDGDPGPQPGDDI